MKVNVDFDRFGIISTLLIVYLAAACYDHALNIREHFIKEKLESSHLKSSDKD